MARLMKTSQVCDLLKAAAKQHRAIGRNDLAYGLEALAEAIKPLSKLVFDDALRQLQQ